MGHRPRQAANLHAQGALRARVTVVHSASLAMTKVYKPLLESIGLTYPPYLAMPVLWESDGIPLREAPTLLGLRANLSR
jgi:hypothetical protein